MKSVMIDRDEYRRTFLYALRRLGKAMRNVIRVVVQQIKGE